MHHKKLFLALFLLAITLTGCSAMQRLNQKYNPQSTINNTKVTQQWQTTLPHAGKHEKLTAFWQQFDDALLVQLITQAQLESSNLASAQARIAQARFNRTQANATLLPMVDGTVSSSRSVQQPATSVNIGGPQQGAFSNGGMPIDSTQAAAQASWELDIFGANQQIYQANLMQEKASRANWHEARVSVAAEVATSYFNQRFCALTAYTLEANSTSLSETLRLTEAAVRAGFSAETNLHLATANLADAKQQLANQHAQCDLETKALVALTNMDEAELRKQLALQPFSHNKQGALFSLDQLPAEVIGQRPDIFVAEANLMSAAANIQTTYASSLPKVSLNGSIGWMWLSGSGFKGDGKTWSLGPISITFPIYHPGVKEAGLANSEAKYEENAAIYREKVRNAVKEVEQALVNLHSTEVRQPDIQTALNGYQTSFEATQTKVNAGFANLIELEEQRRVLIAAQTNMISNQKLRALSWVSLYRAAGGGWDKTTVTETGN